jgi:methylphosphotriester-DNA--protein-cysteine methyltransferase
MTCEEKIEICKRRDASYDGQFYLAVKSTGIVCKPSCPSRVPLDKNMEFFDTYEEAVTAGYRPCKICMKEKWKSAMGRSGMKA